MALIRCPGCGKEISDKSSHCVHCGCPVNSTDITEHPKIDSPNEEYSQEEPQMQESIVPPEGEISVTETTLNKLKSMSKVKKFGVVVVVILSIIVVLYAFTATSKEDKLIMGEWDFSFVYDGDRLVTASELNDVGMIYDNSAVFNKNNFAFSFIGMDFEGTWSYEDVVTNPDSGENAYTYVLTGDDMSCLAIIKESDKDTLMIKFKYSESSKGYLMLIYERV